MPQVPLPNMARQVGTPNAQPLSGARAPMSNMLLQQSQQAAQTMSAVGDSLVQIGAKIRSERDYISAKTDHLKISDYIIQQQIEHSKLSPSDQLGQSEAYRGKVKKFIDDTVTGASSDQARGMLKGPAQQSLLGFKQWSLTRELKAQQAQEVAVEIASFDAASTQAAVLLVQPEGDPLALAAADEMPSDDPDVDTGMSILSQHAENAANSQDPKKPPRSGFQIQRDTAKKIAEDLADIQTFRDPEVREAFIRGKMTDFYEVQINTLLAQDPPMFKKAAGLLDSLSPKEITTGAKSVFRQKVKESSKGFRAKEDLEKGFNVGLAALKSAAIKGSPSGLPLSPAEKLNLAKANIENQQEAGTITYPQYVAARKTLRDEFVDLESEDVESGHRMVTDLFERFPDIASLDDPRLTEPEKQAFRSNYTAMSILEAGRVSQISQGSVAAKSKASKSPSYNMRSFGGRAAWRAATSGSEIANRDYRAKLGDVERYDRDPLAMLDDFKDENGNPSFKKLASRFMAFTGEPKKTWDEVKRLWDIANQQHSAGSKEFDEAGEKALKGFLQDFGSVHRFELGDDGVTLVRTNDLEPQVLAAGLDALRKASGEAVSGGLNLNDMHAFLNSETNKSFLIIDHVSLADRRIPSWLGGMTQAGRAGTPFKASKLRYLSKKGAPLFTNAEEGPGRYQQGMGTVKLGVIAEDAMSYLVDQAKKNPALKAEFLAAGGGDETSGIFNYVYDMLDIVRKDPKWEKDFGKDFKLENGTAVEALKEASKQSRAYSDLSASQPKGEDWSPEAQEAFGGHINPETGFLGASLTGKNIKAALDKLEDKEEGRRYAKWLQTWKQHPTAEVTTADLNSLDEASFSLQDQRSVTLFENTGFHSVEEIEESIKEDRGSLEGLDQKYKTEKKRALYEEYRVLTADMEARQKKWDDETKALEKLVAGRDAGDHAYPRAYAIRTAKLKKQLAVRKKSAMPKDARNVAKIEALKKAAGGTEVLFGSDRWGSYTGTGEGFPDIAKRRMDPEIVMKLHKLAKPIRDSIRDKKALIHQFSTGKGDYSNKDLIAVYAETLEVAQHALKHGHSFQSGESKRALEKIIDNLKKSLRENDTDASDSNPAFQIRLLMKQEGFSWDYVPTAMDLRTGGY